MKQWNKLPIEMQNDHVLPFYNSLKKKKISRFFKSIFDYSVSFLGLLFLALPFLIIAIAIKCDSKGPVFYRQERYTIYKKKFRIFKFRTMYVDADKKGSLITMNNDSRITKIGKFLRKTKIDELPQLINVLLGQMSFVGVRPEVEKYVQCYDEKMLSTFLLKAGITSLASITFKNENNLIKDAENIDKEYVEKILPLKMDLNYKYLSDFNFFTDILYIFKTVL